MAAEMNKSAITDHVTKENHVINWSGAKISQRRHRKTRQVKKASRSGSGKSQTAWTEMACRTAYRLLVTCWTSRDHKPDEVRRWL